MMREAESAKKERDMMAHRSSLYLETLPESGEIEREEARENEMLLLTELENLRAQLEQERIHHSKEMEELQEKLIDKENSDEIFILEEKLNLAEEDIKKSIERAEKAEKALEEQENKRKSMMCRVALFEPNQKECYKDSTEIITETKVVEEQFVPPCAPPPPPMPMPPPPPPMPVSKVANGKTNGSAIADMANILGLKQNTTKKNPSGGE